MNPGRKRRLQQTARAAGSRSKCSKNEESECKPAAASSSSSQSLCPDEGLASSQSPEEAAIHHENTAAARHGEKSTTCNQELCPGFLNEGIMQSAKLVLSSEDETEKTLVITVDHGQSSTRSSGRRKGCLKRKREMSGTAEAGGQQEEDEEDEDEIQPEVEIDQELDRELENKSRQHNLTSANVRNIIHEVITNEHVVAMMKAAINDTEPVPLFEPKMTRSKLKEVVEKGVVIPTWNISPIKKPSKMKGPQFVDIPLEEEDSSDEEYHPDEEEDDETAEDTLLESDLESTASSPRGTRKSLSRSFSEYDGENSCSPRQSLHRARHLRVEVVPMGPPPPPQGPEPPGPPKECSFMEKLYAVDEELAIGSDCIDTYQSLSSNGEDSLMAFRTRSKRPLRDVPLGRLEAELRAPDITPDMYEPGSATEDREWTQWLQGLMCSDVENEEEADDDDDPEYNFLADLDEPDVEDYRNDKAVRIPKKEVNDLMEELFDAFQDELGGQDEEGHEDEDEKEEDDTTQQEPSSILETLEYEDPLADIRKQRFRTVKEQLAAIRKRKAFLESKGVFIPPPAPKCPTSPSGPMLLTHSQKLHLQQHIQQHVQLLTQVNMLSRSVKPLQTEACTARQFLLELQFFAQQGEKARSEVEPGFVSIFRACNLQAAISLLEELDNSPKTDPQPHGPLFPGTQIPAHLAWLMATRPVFLYPELLPRVDLSTFHYKGPFTSAENCLVVLGHKHFQGTLHPLQLACQYLLVARNLVCLTSHMRFFFQKESPSILKNYFLDGVYPSMPLACERVSPGDMCPPVERERRLMPYWLSENLQLIKDEVRKFNPQLHSSQPAQPEDTTLAPSTISAISEPASPSCAFTSNTQYPPWLPETLAESLKPRPPGSRRKKNSDLSAQTVTEPSKPSPPPKEVVEALSRLPLIAPKNPCSSVNTFIYPANQANPPCNKKSKTNPPSSRTVTRKRNGEIQTEPTKFTNPTDSNQEKLIMTLPTAAVNSSSVDETCLMPAGSGEGLVTSLPAASLATSLNLPSLGDVAVKTTEIHSAGSSTAELTLPGPNQANVIILPATSAATAFICPTPINKLMTQTPVSFTQLAKDHISQRCGTLLRLSTGPRIPLGMNPPKPLSLPQNTLHQFLILPPGCIVTNSANLNQKPVTAHDQTPPLTQDSMTMESVTQSSLGNISEGMQDFNADLQNSKSNKALEGSSALNKVIEEEELDEVEMLGNEGDPEEYEEEDFRKPFLTLSESSGSPTPSLSGDDVAMVTVMAEDEREQRQPSTEGERSVEVLERKTEGEHSGKVTSPASETSVLSLPELKETIEKLSRLASEPSSEDKGLSEELQSEEALLYDDFSDDDPQKDSKDVAFAQAYLEKACEVLQVVPGKVEEFLGVLYEFERDPEGRTSVELFKRLKPVLKDWPELLSDFAAFLHPEQANECGLLSEQQAFERSRRFLRQLELTFGEHSVHYRRVVRTLQQGPSKSLSGLKEMKTQLAMLFRDHPHLLEEYWVFFERLHSTVQCRSDDAEEVEEEDLDCDDSDSVCSVQTVHSVEAEQEDQLFRALNSEEKTDNHTSQTHNKNKADIVTQDAEYHVAGPEVEDENSKERDTQFCLQIPKSPVCAKNSSRMPSGEKVVLWTREADRVILTTCQQRGASQSTFSFIAAQLGNKTATEVGARYLDLINLFHRSTKQIQTCLLDTEVQSRPREEEPD
ncbi:GON-4-like protein [Astyanax mexicanus]|uniref:GON-4-like protein n=1 Tax=Astyanax mexicanus TaxID=7994 RepID=A0A8T2MFG1_ASTMX|nr:GON-4-like protein [Astyanax mexicanus]